MNEIAAVVVTYNRKELLLQCLDHLSKQTVPCDILVIDNGSSDGTGEAVKQLDLKDALYFNTGKNLGGAGGFHYGMKAAADHGYQYAWVMDDDTLPESHALSQLVSADRELNGNYGFLCSRVLWTDGSNCVMNMPRKSMYRDIDGWNEALVPCVLASFVSLFLRTETIRTFGLPISEFFIWSDDWEYTRRISLKKKCFAVRDSIVIHAMKSQKPVSVAEDSPDRIPRYRYFYRNDVYLYRREGVLGWVWLILKDFYHTILVLTRSKSDKKQKIQMIWNGFSEGIHFHVPPENYRYH